MNANRMGRNLIACTEISSTIFIYLLANLGYFAKEEWIHGMKDMKYVQNMCVVYRNFAK